MERLIKFRLMVEGLSHNEFDQMLYKMHKSMGKNIFIKSLFTYFMKQNEKIENINTANMDNINKTNKILTDIILSRNNTAKQKHSIQIKSKRQQTRVSMTSLPSSLIASTSSFLSLSDYTKFERLNRYIFTSCRIIDGHSIPIKTIQHQDNIQYNHYHFWIQRFSKHCQLYQHTLNLKRFKNIENICFDLSYSNSIPKPLQKSRIWNNIQKLKLYSINNWIDKHAMNQFIDSNYCNLSAVKHLILSDFGCTTFNWQILKEYTQIFLKLLCLKKLSNVECLELLNISNASIDLRVIDDNYNSPNNVFYYLFPNLRALHYEANNKIGQLMVDLFGHQLESLHIHDNITSKEWYCACLHRNIYGLQCEMCGNQNPYQINTEHIKFIKLKELCVYNQEDDTIFNSIIKSAKNLKKLHISFHNNAQHINTAIKTMLENILQNQQEIEYISLETDSFTPIVDVFEKMQHLSLDRLKLKIIVREVIFDDELKSSLIVIKKCLKKMIKYDFMVLLRVDIETKDRDKDYLEMKQCIRNIKKDSNYDGVFYIGDNSDCIINCNIKWSDNYDYVKKYEYHTVSMAISNKDCKINGYQERWVMNCKHCETNDFIPFHYK